MDYQDRYYIQKIIEDLRRGADIAAAHGDLNELVRIAATAAALARGLDAGEQLTPSIWYMVDAVVTLAAARITLAARSYPHDGAWERAVDDVAALVKKTAEMRPFKAKEKEA